jgi:hypothetical protein
VGLAGAMVLLAGVAVPIVSNGMSAGAAPPSLDPVPRAVCGPGSDPETGMQGRVSQEDVDSGRAARGYSCNTEVVSQYGSAGGFRVHRYTDVNGHSCMYLDTTLLFPTNALMGSTNQTGVDVLDVTDPANPVKTATLSTAAMLSPHESLSINKKRGLLAADLGNPFTYPGQFDIYSIKDDCRTPVLKATTPVGVTGHEGTFSPDGRTFWVASAGGGNLTALDISDPTTPVPVWIQSGVFVHGLNVSKSGNKLFYAQLGYNGASPGLTILNVREIQSRVTNPQVTEISHLTWETVSIPQVPIPVKINHHKYIIEIDEFASNQGSGDPLPASDADATVGAARIIDIADKFNPVVVSNIRLEVNTPEGRAASINDPGASNPLQGYTGHYCAVPQLNNPGIVACSFILSGLRVFDIRDPLNPKELAYYNVPYQAQPTPGFGGNYAMSAPAFDKARRQIAYTDGFNGLYTLQLTNNAWP